MNSFKIKKFTTLRNTPQKGEGKLRRVNMSSYTVEFETYFHPSFEFLTTIYYYNYKA